RMLAYLGAPVRCAEGMVQVEGGAALRPFDLDVPGDISSAAFFLAAGLLAPASAVTVPRVGVNSTRTGVLDVLRAMDATLPMAQEAQEGGDGPEPVATLASS